MSGGRVVGLDPGAVRVGVAVSDEEKRLALPRATVARDKDDKKTAAAIAAALEGDVVDTLVVGAPLRLDGTVGEAARRAQAFGDAMGSLLGVDVVHWDERLTTTVAEEGLRRAGLDAKKQKAVVDQAAAAVILQSYLDAQGGPSWQGQDIPEDVLAAPAPERRRGKKRRGRR